MTDDDRQDSIDRDEMEEMLSIGEAADYIGVSVDTLRRWSKKDRVTTYRSPGGHRYYKKKDLRQLFDAKYTRDEPTERSTQDEIKDETKQEEPKKDDLEAQKDEEDISIPKMQPVKIISGVQDPQNYPVPDLMTPPSPMPTTQQPQPQPSHPHLQMQTITMESVEISSHQTAGQMQFYRQPAAPINQQQEEAKRIIDITNTVISDHTSSAKNDISRNGPTSDPSNVDAVEEEKRILQSSSVQQSTESRKQTTQSPEVESKSASDNNEPPSSEIKLEEEEVGMDRFSTIRKKPASQTQTQQMDLQDKEKESEPEKITKTEVEKKTEVRQEQNTSKPAEDKIEKQSTPQDSSTSDNKDSVEERINQIKEQKKSILDPEQATNASKINQIDKREEEGWFARNKSNILIGFTVFLLIDIILFVVWLTTSRLLSPLP